MTGKNMTLIHDLYYKNLGRLYNNEMALIAYTLDPLLIKPGRYNVEINYSPKFKTQLPLIYNEEFPASRGIREHAGNSLKDTQGCILIGLEYKIDLNGNITLLRSKEGLNNVIGDLRKNQDWSLNVI